MPNTSLHSTLPHTRPFLLFDTSSLLHFITLPLQLPRALLKRTLTLIAALTIGTQLLLPFWLSFVDFLPG
jgi:hypothetical protein